MKNKLTKLVCVVLFLACLSSCTEHPVEPKEGPSDPASGQATGE